MKCIVCGCRGAEPRECCEDRPVFCKGCNEAHHTLTHGEYKIESRAGTLHDPDAEEEPS